MLTRIKAIVLLSILLLNLAGYYVAFNGYEKYLKRQNKSLIFNTLPNSELEVLTIPKVHTENKSVFKRIKKWEISYFDIMFDFVNEVEKNDTLYFYGFTDKKEIRLNKIKKYVADSDFNKNKDDAKILLVNILNLIPQFIPTKEIHNNYNFCYLSPTVFFYSNLYSSLFIIPEKRPPNLIAS